MLYRKKSIGLLLLAFIFCPQIAYANGMGGLAYIIMLFVIFVSAVPGAILKHLLPLPAKGSRVFSGIVLIVMLAETILIGGSTVIYFFLFTPESPCAYPMYLIPATLIYSFCAIFPNMLLLRGETHSFFEAFYKPQNVFYAILLGLPTAICYGLITIRFIYSKPMFMTLLYLWLHFREAWSGLCP